MSKQILDKISTTGVIQSKSLTRTRRGLVR